MRDQHLTRDAEQIARSQFGVITRRQAASAGITARMIDRLLDRGDWRRLAPGVYALAAFPSNWQRQYKAAELSVPGSSIAHLAATWVHQFDGFRYAAPELVASHAARHAIPLAIVHRATRVETMSYRGFTVTSPAQTLFDIAPRVSLERWERACDGLILSGRMTVADLERQLEVHGRSRRPGVGTFRALVADRQHDGWVVPESELERLLRAAITLVPGCPPVIWQANLPWGAPGEGRVDGYIPVWRTILEADGRRWHARLRAFDADRWRDNEATAAGLGVLRFTWTHLTQRMDECAAMIRRAGAMRAAA